MRTATKSITGEMYCSECGEQLNTVSGHTKCPGAQILLDAFITDRGSVELRVERKRRSFLTPEAGYHLTFFTAPGREHNWDNELKAREAFSALCVSMGGEKVPAKSFDEYFASKNLPPAYEGEG